MVGFPTDHRSRESVQMNQPSSILDDVQKKCRGALIAVGVVSLFVNILMLTVPLYMLQIFDRVLMSRSDETLLYLSFAAVGHHRTLFEQDNTVDLRWDLVDTRHLGGT